MGGINFASRSAGQPRKAESPALPGFLTIFIFHQFISPAWRSDV